MCGSGKRVRIPRLVVISGLSWALGVLFLRFGVAGCAPASKPGACLHVKLYDIQAY